jgi:hypothetical protein
MVKKQALKPGETAVSLKVRIEIVRSNSLHLYRSVPVFWVVIRTYIVSYPVGSVAINLG